MKQTVILIIALLAFSACRYDKKKASENEKPVITVSILPQKYFVEQIAGNFFDINVLVAPGSDPHEYEPTARQMTQLARSEVYFFIGHLGFEKPWLEKISASAPKTLMVSNSMGLDLLEQDCGHEEEDHAHHHGTDPHIWTSPQNVKTISKNICAVLVSLYPGQKEVFESNLNQFLKSIDELDFHIREQLNNSKKEAFLIYHPALGYFARDYYLEQYAIEFEGKTPSPAYMKEIIDFSRGHSIKTIFIQSQFDQSKAEAIARETGSVIVPVDPLAYEWHEEMLTLTSKLKTALNE